MRYIGYAIFLLFATMLLTKVNAISVASDYLANDTFELVEGTSKLYSIRLQNPTQQEVAVRIDYDASFMQIINYKEVYILPPKESGYRILFNVTAPKDQGLYKVGYTISEVEPSSGGLPIRLKINRNFNLKIVELPKAELKRQTFMYTPLILIVALFLIILLIYIKRKK